MVNKHHPGPGKWPAALLLVPQRYILGFDGSMDSTTMGTVFVASYDGTIVAELQEDLSAVKWQSIGYVRPDSFRLH